MTPFRTLIKAGSKKERFFDLGQRKAMEPEAVPYCAVSKSNQDLSDRASMLGFSDNCNPCKMPLTQRIPKIYAISNRNSV